MACWSTASVELCLSQVLEGFFASAVNVIFASSANLRSNSNHRVSATHLISPVSCFDVRACCKFILVCEKESVFNRLAADGFCRFAKCVFTAVAAKEHALVSARSSSGSSDCSAILISGRGMPDVATREFTRSLALATKLPVAGVLLHRPRCLHRSLQQTLLASKSSREPQVPVVGCSSWIGTPLVRASCANTDSALGMSPCHLPVAPLTIRSSQSVSAHTRNARASSLKGHLPVMHGQSGLDCALRTFKRDRP